MDWNELLHPLSTLLTGMVFGFHIVFSFCGKLQGSGRDPPKIWNPFCSTLWTGFGLTSLHTVILWCHMRCPMILSMIGQTRTSCVCLFRENKKSSPICGSSPERSKLTSWPFHWWSMDHGWVSTGELALVCWVQWKLSVWQGWEFTICPTAWVQVRESQTDPTVWGKVHCAQKGIFIL